MQYLEERQVGFDLQALGYPSIDGCHAIALRTETGIYGFHNFGGSGSNSFEERSKSFAHYVTNHFVSRGTDVALYSVCFRNKRGYENADPKQWKAEMKAMAKELGYKGKVYGYDLGLLGYAGSAYVEMRVGGDKLAVYANPWANMSAVKGKQTDLVNLKTTGGGKSKPVTASQITTGVTGGGTLTKVTDGAINSFKV